MDEFLHMNRRFPGFENRLRHFPGNPFPVLDAARQQKSLTRHVGNPRINSRQSRRQEIGQQRMAVVSGDPDILRHGKSFLPEIFQKSRRRIILRDEIKSLFPEMLLQKTPAQLIERIRRDTFMNPDIRLSAFFSASRKPSIRFCSQALIFSAWRIT